MDDLHDDDAMDSLLRSEPEPDDEELWGLRQEIAADAAREQSLWEERTQREALADIALQLLPVLADLTDDDPCAYDHDGHCRAHGWSTAAPTCPHARSRRLVSQLKTEHPELFR